jgi:hypothetical protein
VRRLAVWLLVPLLPACSAAPLPTQPSPTVVPSIGIMALEAEAGRGDGQVRERSRASGGLTVHLGPGEQRVWTFDTRAAEVRLALSIAYSNGKEGENETLSVAIDGRPVISFQNRDSGDAVDGWNEFVTDPAGTMTLGPGSHTLRLEVSGGDGCVEIDVAMLSPAQSTL